MPRKKRGRILKQARYNLFNIPSRMVTVDLLTDSGTGELSHQQMELQNRADEAYAYAASYEKLERAAKEFSGFSHVLPVHQGRGAESLIAHFLKETGRVRENDILLSNGFFDTTRANFEHAGARCINIPTPKSLDIESNTPFKGDIDLQKLEEYLGSEKGKQAKAILLTLTNNTGGGQPVSFQNVLRTKILAEQYNKLLIIDACRIVENAYFVQREEMPGFSYKDVVRLLFGYADIAYMSAKKDGLANGGGFIVTDHDDLFEELSNITMGFLLRTYGFRHYAGMTGATMETVARGLKEVVKPSYLRKRVADTAYLHAKLKKIGVPVLCPPGGHAVYVDAAAMLPHISKEQFPGKALEVALYFEGGIRSCEIGSVMFGDAAQYEWVRLAIPRRKYKRIAFDYIACVFERLLRKKDSMRGFSTEEAPGLRHFYADFKPL